MAAPFMSRHVHMKFLLRAVQGGGMEESVLQPLLFWVNSHLTSAGRKWLTAPLTPTQNQIDPVYQDCFMFQILF